MIFFIFLSKKFETEQIWLILIKIRSNFNQNRERWLEIVIEIRVGPKSTIEFEIRTRFDDDDSIR